jgi:hypothetical protein
MAGELVRFGGRAGHPLYSSHFPPPTPAEYSALPLSSPSLSVSGREGVTVAAKCRSLVKFTPCTDTGVTPVVASLHSEKVDREAISSNLPKAARRSL